MGLNVALMANIGKNDPPAAGEPPDAHAELDSEATVTAIADALRAAGHTVSFIPGDADACERLRQWPTDIVYNICEGLRGQSRESQIPALLEMLGIPYTGSGVLALALALDKPAAKKLFAYHGIPTPRFLSVEPGCPVSAEGLRFPLFVKPAREGSSIGVSPHSRVATVAELAAQVGFVHRTYRQAALVEEFVQGREFTVGVLGNRELQLLPIMEINYDPVPAYNGRIYDYQFKQEWDDWTYFACPAPVDAGLAARLNDTAVAAFRALGCADVARVDLRLDADGVPQVLEVNPLPGLTPDYSDLCRAANVAGITYVQLVNRILDAAVTRYGLTNPTRVP